MKRVGVIICQLAILLLSYNLVWGDAIVILGIAAAIVHWMMSLRLTGWISACSYLITYWGAMLLDTPQDGNQYVYWYLSYIAINMMAFAIDLVIRIRRNRIAE